MPENKASLSGKQFKKFDDVDVMYFSEDDFDRWFEMKESDVLKEITEKLKPASENGLTLPNDIPFNGEDKFLLVKQGKKMIVYGWTPAHGPHPLRWEQREDFTDFVSSL